MGARRTMNEPTEHAQRTTGTVTAGALLAVLKGCYSAGLHGRAAPDRESYSDSFIFDVSATRHKKGIETKQAITVPGWVSNGHTDAKETHVSTTNGKPFTVYSAHYRPENGFWWLFATVDRLVGILELLPAKAEIAFYVYLDAGTNPLLVDATLHSDHLYLQASFERRGKQVRRQFLIDVSSGAHNTARFGVPSSFDR